MCAEAGDGVGWDVGIASTMTREKRVRMKGGEGVGLGIASTMTRAKGVSDSGRGKVVSGSDENSFTANPMGKWG